MFFPVIMTDKGTEQTDLKTTGSVEQYLPMLRKAAERGVFAVLHGGK